ncbi:MAG TPA: hypothetical protein VNI35_06700, partial [Nitrospira sp.]|nr:hypothetical protein [Nitrospira sp.]
AGLVPGKVPYEEDGLQVSERNPLAWIRAHHQIASNAEIMSGRRKLLGVAFQEIPLVSRTASIAGPIMRLRVEMRCQGHDG